jgi:hypothetical protein
MKKKFDKIKIRLVFFLIIAAVGFAVYYIQTNRPLYDYTHLTRRADFGAGHVFTPLGGIPELNGMVPVADNATLTLYIDTETSVIAVLDKRNGHIWHSCPPNADADLIANPFEKDIMRSLFSLRYYDEQRRPYIKRSFPDSAHADQFELESIPNGVRIIYEVGDTTLGINLAPVFMEIERFNERMMAPIVASVEDPDCDLFTSSDLRFMQQQAYIVSPSKEGFMQMPSGLRTNAINIERMLNILDILEYTVEELLYDNAQAEHEMEISLDTFYVHVELTITDDTLTYNLPLDKFESSEGANPFFFEIMKYFGAGGSDEEGYLFVPSGSGGLIEFNNRKTNEETYISGIYGLDMIMNVQRPQITTPMRLPVMGIKKEDAAMVAWVESGAAIGTLQAEIAGKINSYNIAWFTFLVRESMVQALAGGSVNDMTIVQQQAFDGDITINYRFIAGEDPGYVEMAHAYQRALIENGSFTRLTPAANAPFYLDILGAVEKRKFVVGTPYRAMEPMTTYKQAHEIVDLLNSEGVHNIQMRWLGWFNRGVNHDVAKKINWTGRIGSRNEMRGLNERLAADGGGLYPSVNLMMTAWTTRNLTRSHEIARDPAGFLGHISNFAREMLRIRGPGRFDSDWFMLIHPAVLPFHIDSFIPAYNKLNMDNLALNDMGDVLSASLYRRNPVDREHSRMISTEQLARLDQAYGSLMVSGGNDYSLAFASHVVDAPTELDRHYIIDSEVPFYQIVVHGFIDHAGSPVNTREVQDAHMALLNSLATGAAPHYLWSYQPTRNIEFTAYDILYSTHYVNWLSQATEHYRVYNGVYRDLRTQRITGHRILSESSSHIAAVTVTEFENGTRVYVNTTNETFRGEGVVVPALWYTVEVMP